MTSEDFEQFRSLLRELIRFETIGVLSPTTEAALFPDATHLSRQHWDLDHPGTQTFDLIIGANVFFYSRNPERWLTHVLASCRYLVLQDVIRRKRSPDRELGPDGDQVRFTVGRERPRIPGPCDLNTLGERVLGFRTYFGGSNEYDDEPLHFIAVIRGDLADPILRIDGYPADAGTAPADLTRTNRILEMAEARGLAYHLGIVPAATSEATLRLLRSFEHLIPAASGADGPAPGARRRLVEHLHRGRSLLEEGLGTSVTEYIPSPGRARWGTGPALADSGFRRYLADVPLPRCDLPFLRASFHGTSESYRPGVDDVNVALDLPAERTAIAAGTDALARLLDDIAERKASERRRGQRLGRFVAGD